MNHVLLVLPEVPWPPVTGGKRAHLATISRLLESGCNLRIVACNIDTTEFSERQFTTGPYGPYTTIVPTASPAIATSTWQQVKSLVIGLFSIYPWHYVHLRRSGAREVITTILQNESFDCIWVDHLYGIAMVPTQINDMKLVLSTQNVEADLTHESARQAAWGIKKAKRYLDYLKVTIWERRLLGRATKLITLSTKDADTLFQRHAIKVQGCLIPLAHAPESDWVPPVLPALTFVGSYNFSPNQEAINWIMKTFSHWLFKDNPDIEIRIVGGGNIPEKLKDLAAPNVRIMGQLSDMSFKQTLKASSALFSPILLGSGIKMKILDAALMGVPIIATAFSLDGLNFITSALIINDRAERKNAKYITETLADIEKLASSSQETTKSLKLLQIANNELLNTLLT